MSNYCSSVYLFIQSFIHLLYIISNDRSISKGSGSSGGGGGDGGSSK
jgi:hypothetical protein